MTKSFKLSRMGNLVLGIIIALFIAFFFYIFFAEDVAVFQRNQHHNYSHLVEMEPELVPDPQAPAGVRKVYRWTLESDYSWEDCLLIYFSHHELEVYLNDQLEYSITVDDDNRIAANVGSNWCSLHVGAHGTGTQVTVVMTPLFEAAIDKNPDIYFGAHYAITMDLLRGEIPPMVFSALCFFLGLVLVAISLYFRFALNTSDNSMMYLGLFSLFLGLWKLTDLASMPLLMPGKSLALTYISVGSLFLTGPCLMMYFSTLFTEKGRRHMYLMVFVGSLICAVILALQLLGISEFRQNLIFSHGILIVALLSIPINAGINRIVHRKTCLLRDQRLILLVLLLVGIILDLVLFYLNNNSSLLSFSIAGLVLYTLIVFTGGVQNATRKAYTDVRTGLVNRARWNELMHTDTAMVEPFGFLMIDLNGLKKANDTLGHEAGDQMIFRLSSILRNSLPRSSVICRWGGDEFAVLLSGIDRTMMDRHMAELIAAGQKYNTDHPELPIHFSLGSALSADHPGASREELFRLADEAMYRDKQIWYSTHA